MQFIRAKDNTQMFGVTYIYTRQEENAKSVFTYSLVTDLFALLLIVLFLCYKFTCSHSRHQLLIWFTKLISLKYFTFVFFSFTHKHAYIHSQCLLIYNHASFSCFLFCFVNYAGGGGCVSVHHLMHCSNH